MTVSFGRGRLNVLGGVIDYGLRAAELHLDVQNGTIPLEGRWPEESLQEKTTIKRTRKYAHAKSRKVATGVEGGMGEKGPTATLSTDHEARENNAHSVNDEFELAIQCVTSSGSPACPVWRFEVPPDKDCLSGQLVDQLLGKVLVSPTAKLATIIARCEIPKRFIYIIDSEGFLPGLSIKKKSVVSMILQAMVHKAIFDELSACLRSIELEAGHHG